MHDDGESGRKERDKRPETNLRPPRLHIGPFPLTTFLIPKLIDRSVLMLRLYSPEALLGPSKRQG